MLRFEHSLELLLFLLHYLLPFLFSGHNHQSTDNCHQRSGRLRVTLPTFTLLTSSPVYPPPL